MQHDTEPGMSRYEAEQFRGMLRSAAKAAGVLPSPAPAPRVTKKACSTCAHWQLLAESETGGQCVIGKYRDCRPLLNAFLYWSPRASP